jgi:hypothetical protein
MRNGKPFTITFVPAGRPSGPGGIYQDECPTQNWTREDLNYYYVQVGAGVAAGGIEYLELTANLGTISP